MTLPARLLHAAAVACLLALPCPPAAAQSIEVVTLPDPFGAAWRSIPDRAWGVAPRGAVIVLPDAAGQDGRATPYVEALLRQGFVVLEIGMGDPPLDRAQLDAALVVAGGVLAREGRFGAGRIGVLGFGEGAEVALARAGSRPVAALYPRCAAVDALPVPEAPNGRAALLLLHPARDATDRAGACARLVDGFGPGGFRHAYPDATPGWDIPPVAIGAGPVLQPRDSATYAGAGGGTRYVPWSRPGVTDDAARRAAWFMAAAIEGRGPWQLPGADP
jgi:dienelactone hydrolase